jgi:Na+-transporting methylmalonyl-CoA/oxaloacetate decarboxylase gamma subunit
MSFIYIPGKTARLPFNVPSGACCNCGLDQGVTLNETPLKKTRYMLLGGTELMFTLQLPYCKRCAVTAKRFPVGFGKKLLVSFGVFWVLFLLAFAVPGMSPAMVDRLPAMAGAIALASTFGFYAIRKAVPPQTSYYQPVTLKAVKQEFSGAVLGVTLHCSHAGFAREFSAANRETLAAGQLTVTQG